MTSLQYYVLYLYIFLSFILSSIYVSLFIVFYISVLIDVNESSDSSFDFRILLDYFELNVLDLLNYSSVILLFGLFL
jgi:hypothetical protein